MSASYTTTTIASGSPARPFANAFTNERLPANATTDSGSGAAITELVSQSTIAAPTLNVNSWTAEITVVPGGTPLVPVTLTQSGLGDLATIFKLGVPIPPGTTPTADSDATIILWEPGYVNPHDPTIIGRYWELYHVVVKTNADGSVSYTAKTGAKFFNSNVTTRLWTAYQTGLNHAAFATDPDCTYSPSQNMFVQGSGIAYAPGLLTVSDCSRGFVDHGLNFSVVHSLASGHVWPAVRSDGNSSTSVLREGQRYRFPDGYTIPATMHPLGQLLVQGVRDYGMLLTDQAGCLAFRATPSCLPYLNGAHGYDVLKGFPWQDLQLLVPGTAANPVPTA